MSELFASPDLVYARRTAGLADFVGGGAEHWDVSGATGVVATVTEDLTALDRAGRLVNNLFPKQQRRRMRMRDATGQTLFEMVKRPPRLGSERTEVLTADGAPMGTVRLIRTAGSEWLGLGFYDSQDTPLGEARYAQRKTAASGHRTFDMLAADGTPIGELASTKTRGGAGSSGYRLQVTLGLSEPLRSLVYAAPIARYFMR